MHANFISTKSCINIYNFFIEIVEFLHSAKIHFIHLF